MGVLTTVDAWPFLDSLGLFCILGVLLIVVAVLARADTEPFLEGVVEVRHVLKADVEADHGHALLRWPQHRRRLGQPSLVDEVADRDLSLFLEQMLEPRRPQPDR